MTKPGRALSAALTSDATLWRGVLLLSVLGVAFGALFLYATVQAVSLGDPWLPVVSQGMTGVAVLAAGLYGLREGARRLRAAAPPQSSREP